MFICMKLVKILLRLKSFCCQPCPSGRLPIAPNLFEVLRLAREVVLFGDEVLPPGEADLLIDGA